MTWFEEKCFFAASVGSAAAASWVGAIMTAAEVRWIYVTLAASVLCAGFLALTFRQPGETIQLLIGRSCIAILGGIFGPRLAIGLLDLDAAHTDLIYLAGVANLFCAASFLVGFAFLRALESSSNTIASSLLQTVLGWLFRKGPPPP